MGGGAHVAGVLSAPKPRRSRRARAILAKGADPAFFESAAAADDEDVHSFVERELVARVGDAGAGCTPGDRATSRSRSICGSTSKRRVRFQQKIEALVAALADQAVAAGDAVMPSYTHLRRAQPILVSHFFLAHAAALRRDHRALRGVR